MFRLRDRFMSFMYGRYGADQLYYALFVVYVLLLVLNIFTPYVIIDILMWSVLAWMFSVCFPVISIVDKKKMQYFSRFGTLLNQNFLYYYAVFEKLKPTVSVNAIIVKRHLDSHAEQGNTW